MTFKKTKEQLSQLLDEADIRVIALSGKWGTGKTHLIDELRTSHPKAKRAIYISLFGLSSIDQLKRKLIEAAVPMSDSHGGTFDSIKELFKVGFKVASEHYKALAALSDVNLLMMAPVVLRNSLLIVDDIERKHETLGIDEVLGFIDEYSKQFETRFILILNDDQLGVAHKQSWQTLHEKVIDQGLKLTTAPDEAFGIAISLSPSSFQGALKQAALTCGLTNIRIIRQVIKVANRILGTQPMDEAIVARVIPSIVLFSAIHYRGLNDGPDVQFALNIGSSFDWAAYERKKKSESTEEDIRADGWRLLIQELNIRGCDEFETVLVEFLESGLFESSRIDAIIERYKSEHENLQAREAAQQFLFKEFWDHHLSNAQILAEAAIFPKIAHMLDPYVITQLEEVLLELDGGAFVGQEMIKAWIEAFRARTNAVEVTDDNPFNRPLHPLIKAEFDQHNRSVQANATIVDAVRTIQNGGWNTKEELILKRATASDFENAIRTMDIADLQGFMRRMIDMRSNKDTYEKHFGMATDHFMDACKAIAADTSSTRLAKLIGKLIEKTIAAEQGPAPAGEEVE